MVEKSFETIEDRISYFINGVLILIIYLGENYFTYFALPSMFHR